MKKLILKNKQDYLFGWKTLKISDLVYEPKQEIVDGPFGSNLKSTEYVKKGIPLIRLQNINRNEFVNKNIKYITKEKSEQLKRHNYKNGDIVITKLGAPLGEACIIPESIPDGIIVADIVRIRIRHKWISKKFLMHNINSEKIIQQFKKYTKGTTRPRINLKQIREFNIRIPPLNEQKRIVSKIESIFTQIDAGKEKLEKVKVLLTQQRQSVLKSAFEGKLVPQDPNDESAEILFNKICQNSKNELILKKNKFIPKNWIEIPLNEIRINTSRSIIPNKTKNRLFELYSVPSWNINKPEIIKGEEIRSNKQIVDKKTVLLCKINPKINRVWIVGNHSPYTKIASTEWIPFFKLEGVSPNYLCYFLKNENFRNFLSLNVSGVGGSLTRIKPDVLNHYLIVIPPLNEQKRIVSKIESIFGRIDSQITQYFWNNFWLFS